MARDFQSVVEYEARKHFLEIAGMIPDEACTCMSAGSSSIDMFKPFLDDPVDITGVEYYGYRDQFMD